MTRDVSQEKQEPEQQFGETGSVRPDLAHLDAAVSHVDQMVTSGSIATSAAKGILYSLIETLGAFVGDPDLPEHARSGYEGLLESARELRARIDR
ncbi:hypothetical protein [Paraburkholderia sp.]|uniref:hypothetical protein n=1 Tax=Paraburkholderia sp. TaxID=1926495 RepID=UPI0023902494|nr:hypothetical protein [Paraburkholderia sp.]MDE1180318.1 hypothetical protein [Paraburkholderia sp.]